MRETFRDIGLIIAAWIFWRPWRALVTVVALFLIAAGASAAVGHPKPAATPVAARHVHHRPAATPSSAAPTPTRTRARTVTPKPTPTTTTRTTTPPASGITDTASRFTRAWVRHTSPAKWVTGMTPYATPRLVRLFRHGNPANVPANHVTGAPRIGEYAPGNRVAVTVPTDTYPAQLVLARVHGRWLVDQINVTRT